MLVVGRRTVPGRSWTPDAWAALQSRWRARNSLPRGRGAHHRQLIRRKADISGEARIERWASPKLTPSVVAFEPDRYAGTPPAESMERDLRMWNAHLSSSACMPPRHLTAEICLDAIPIGVDDKGGVVVRAIVRAQAGRAIVGATSAKGSDMERIDGLTCGRGKAEVEV
jgi:hypothetical protein